MAKISKIGLNVLTPLLLMDQKKAFDTVQHSILFQKLIHRGIPKVYVRLLLLMYFKQFANVRWNNVSQKFPITNGVKQGAVLSAILCCVYIGGLFSPLRRNRSGCWIGGQFCRMLGYADDIMLVSPTIDRRQEMINSSADFMKSHNLTFSCTLLDPRKCETKCMAFSKKTYEIKPLCTNGDEVPWVTTTKHLGTTLETNLDGMSKDLMEKRAMFINRNNELI